MSLNINGVDVQTESAEQSSKNDQGGISVADESQKTPPKKSPWRSFSVYIFYALAFLMPLFVLPLGVAPVAFSKAILFYVGILLAFVFWLFSLLQSGKLSLPKSLLSVSICFVVLVWLFSSIFSSNPGLSFIGEGYEIGTFAFFALLGVAMLIASDLFRSEKRVKTFYFLIFASAVVVFLFQFLHVIFGVTLAPKSVFSALTSNLIGGWNDFAIFFGFVALSAMSFFGLFKLSRLLKLVAITLITLSLLAMVSVNFFTVWIIFGFFALFFLIYLFSGIFYKSYGENGKLFDLTKIPKLPLLILALVIFFVLARGLMGGVTSFLETGIIEVRPSWQATWDITQHTLRDNLLLGSGPNTFVYEWLKFKPPSVNNTLFWNTRFQSGIGHLPSMVVTAGVFGVIALLSLLVSVFHCAMRALSRSKEQDGLNDGDKMAIIALVGSLYLWSFTIFYSPGFVIFAFAFLTTGVLTGLLVKTKKIKSWNISFLRSPRAGFVSVLLIVLLLIGSVATIYLLFQKYLASHYYTEAANVLVLRGDADASESNLVKANRIDARDRYHRGLAEIGVIRMRDILVQQDVAPEVLRGQFQTALSVTIQNAQKAIDLNSSDPLNWMQLGRVYELVVPFNISGASNFAISSYQEALNRSPFDPAPFVGMARVALQSNDTAKAREYLNSSLAIKGDFAVALLLLSQMEVEEGNVAEAIQRTEQLAMIAPNDVGVLFQLALLYYQNEDFANSRLAFERVVLLNPSYSNARYFLGLIYDLAGMNTEAIEQFEKIQELNPDNEEVKKILENLYVKSKALMGISPPQKSPERREEPPINEVYNEVPTGLEY